MELHTLGARVVCGTSILAFISCACRRNPCKSASHTKRRSRIDAPAKADIVVLHGAATRYDEQLRAFSRISRSIEKRTTKSTSTLFPDDRLNLSFVRKKWSLITNTIFGQSWSAPSVSSLARASAGAAAPRDERSIAGARAAWPHGSLGAHHAATRFFGAAHRLVVEL